MPNWLKRWLVRLTLLTLAYYLWFPLFIYRLSESQDNRITVIDAYRMDNTKIPINRPYDPQMFSLTLANGTTISLKDSFLLKHSMNTKLIKNHFYYYTDLPIENDYPEETKGKYIT